ncbi:putative addiction module antidote protein [Rhizobiales bacterium TNE-4]|nr:putative addiction module antidote protein [Rhizobiales bacterium TNE-4]MBV1828336.1 putative addiction module antidote protein [Rhizobiales bacterium TNE-4]
MATAPLPFNPADYIKTEEDAAFFLSEAFATGDPSFIAEALGILGKLKGMTALARETGLSRESLYRSLSRTGNPELATLIKVAAALGLTLSAAPRDKPTEQP